MQINFTKMQGCGNDYVYIDGGKELVPQEKKSDLARKVSDRHFGIGSDGLIFINPVDDPDIDFEMEMYNADGSRSEMCGNGIRCVAKYVYDNRLTDKKKLTIVSAGQKKYIDLTVDEKDLVTSVKVDMGAPILEASKVPVNMERGDGSSVPVTDMEQGDGSSVPCSDVERENRPLVSPLVSVADVERKNRPLVPPVTQAVIDAPLTVAGKEWRITCVSMGNPHAVVFLPEGTDLKNFDIEAIGPLFENHKVFPNRTNTEFVTIDDKRNVHMRVWERGTGETLACGTGCCATTVACILNGHTDNTVTVHVLGGDITCSWNGDPASPVIMEGPATTVFTGKIEVE